MGRRCTVMHADKKGGDMGRIRALGMVVLGWTLLAGGLSAQQIGSSPIYYSGGNVGIGTASPSYTLDVNGNAIARGDLVVQNSGTNDSVVFLNSPAGPAEGFVGVVAVDNHWVTGSLAGDTFIRAQQNLYFANASGTPTMALKASGNVGIGTVQPQYPLSVNGVVQAKEVLVNTGWSDYVFDAGYRLAPLAEVDTYIRENHRLPEMPSAAEVAEKGVGVGQMESKLLAKIEELTLHMIRAERENAELRERVKKLEGARR